MQVMLLVSQTVWEKMFIVRTNDTFISIFGGLPICRHQYAGGSESRLLLLKRSKLFQKQASASSQKLATIQIQTLICRQEKIMKCFGECGVNTNKKLCLVLYAFGNCTSAGIS